MIFLPLPDEISQLMDASNRLKAKYCHLGLKFTLDGNLVGDIGEAIAAEWFGINLARANQEGFDGIAPDGKTTVSVKAFGEGRTPAFRNTAIEPDHLLCLELDYENLQAVVFFNGPYRQVRQLLRPEGWTGQKAVSRTRLQKANSEFAKTQKLALIAKAEN